MKIDLDPRQPGLYASEPVPAPQLHTIEDRMLYLLECNGWSEREWARRARQIKEPAQVNKVLLAVRMAPTRPTVETWVFMALADAAQVTLDWLLFGYGPMYRDQSQGDPYPSRAAAINSARLKGKIPTEVIATVAAERGHKADPGSEYWLTRLSALTSEHGANVPSRRKKSTRPKKD